ncbi:MAG: GatB/YqeY domain-containing protein [Haliscomenobacter sp.]|nr:GatB/YqeY domain-containing protein [Haliscomenobacter sp.]MBK7475384.1 GatB/YqeY domain-containing protein [Haliscomenobacter sp.]MBK8877967.1 GatB/YqeY domain-containing protein [Haliscomenobacter sp.]
MTLEELIMEDLKTAMRDKNEAAKRGIRAIKAAILLAKTDGSGQEVNQEREIQILQKLVKQRRESLEIYHREHREDLAQKEREEIEVIEKYLPKALTPEELEAALKEIIRETGAASLKDLGKVMGIASKRLAGKADGKAISEMVKSLLS